MAHKNINHLRSGIVRVARTHFLFVALFTAQIMIYDAWDLIDPTSLMRRWWMAAVLLVASSYVWYRARGGGNDLVSYKRLVYWLVAADIAAASLNVYLQRGMASKAVMLYAIPILVSGVLLTRSALYFATALSIAAYTTTAVSYFVLNFNEGYKIELYGEITFYSFVMILFAELLWTIIRTRKA